VPTTLRVDVSLPICKTRIEGGKGVEGGASTTQVAVKRGVYETYPWEDQARFPKRWNQPQFRVPETRGKLQTRYLQRNFDGLEVSRWSSAGSTARK
jgi:hypothetical protein